MKKQKMIKKLEEIKEKVDWDSDDELTDYARERAYVCVQQAIEFLSENEEYKAVVPASEERDDDPTCDVVDDYTIGFATYLMQKRRDEVDKMQAEIERLKEENACLLKACEEKFTFDTTQNKKYSVFNSVRKEFADKVTAKLFSVFGKTICSDLDTEDITDIIDELLKEYGNGENKS